MQTSIPVLVSEQNYYELTLFSQAQASLERVLAIARAKGAHWAEYLALFQLGVLAFETGDYPAARRVMGERLAAAKAAGDKEEIADAQAALGELERKIGDM